MSFLFFCCFSVKSYLFLFKEPVTHWSVSAVKSTNSVAKRSCSTETLLNFTMWKQGD